MDSGGGVSDSDDKDKEVLSDCRELFNHLSELEVQLAAAVKLQNKSESESHGAHCGELAKTEEEKADLKERARLLKESSRTTVQQFLTQIGPLLQAHQDLKEEFSRVNTVQAEDTGTPKAAGNFDEVGGLVEGGTAVLIPASESPFVACADEAAGEPAGEPMASYPPSLGSSRCPLELTVVGSPEDEDASARQDAILAAARALLGQRAEAEAPAVGESSLESAHECRRRYLDADPSSSFLHANASSGALPMYTPRVLPPQAIPDMEGIGAGVFAGAEDRPFCRNSSVRVTRAQALSNDFWEGAPVVSAPAVQAASVKMLPSTPGLARPPSAPHYAVSAQQIVQSRVVLPRAVSPGPARAASPAPVRAASPAPVRAASPTPVQGSEITSRIAQPRGVPTHAIIRTSSPMQRSAEVVSTVSRVASSPRPFTPAATPTPFAHSGSMVAPAGRPRSVSPPIGRPGSLSPGRFVDAAHWESAAAATAAPGHSSEVVLSPRLGQMRSRPQEVSPRYCAEVGAHRELSPMRYRTETVAPPRDRELSPIQYHRTEAVAPPRDLSPRLVAPLREVSPKHYRPEVAAPLPELPPRMRRPEAAAAPAQELSTGYPRNQHLEGTTAPQMLSARPYSAGQLTPVRYRHQPGASSPGIPGHAIACNTRESGVTSAAKAGSKVIRFSSGPSSCTMLKTHWSPQATASPMPADGMRVKPCFPKQGGGSVNLARSGGMKSSCSGTKLWL